MTLTKPKRLHRPRGSGAAKGTKDDTTANGKRLWPFWIGPEHEIALRRIAKVRNLDSLSEAARFAIASEFNRVEMDVRLAAGKLKKECKK